MPRINSSSIVTPAFRGGRFYKSLAEFAPAGAKKLNHFSDDMRVRKILLGQQVHPSGARSRPQSLLAMKSKISCQ
jgi:hypothetical protein